MHKARAFFYVCAGLLPLALSYHLGARSAGAQAGDRLTCARIDVGGFHDRLFTDSGNVLWVSHNLDYTTFATTVVGNTGSLSPIIEVVSTGFGYNVAAYAEDGGIYASTDDGQHFVYRGNVLTSGTPTPAQREAFGVLKSRYRGAPGAAQPATRDR